MDIVEAPVFEYTPDPNAGQFNLLLIQEGVSTIDGRMFEPDSISWREPPFVLTLNRENTVEGQHKKSVAIGMVTDVAKIDGAVYGHGYFSSDEEGQAARLMIKEGVISSVSADVGGAVYQDLSEDTAASFAAANAPENVHRLYSAGKIMGVTALLHGAFDDTRIGVVNEDPITAAAGTPFTPPADVFANPKLTEPTPFTLTADGRVYGHAAIWGTCHIGYRDRCVTPPRSASNYAFFNTGTVLTADASAKHVGRLTADAHHATAEMSASVAVGHYDHTGYAAAFVAAGEDEIGIWFSGVISPDATEQQIMNLRAAGVSGDWRSINGSLEMVGLLAVNTPGFPIPRAQAGIVAGAQISLTAAGFVPVPDCGCNEIDVEIVELAEETITIPAEILPSEDFDYGAAMTNCPELQWTSDLDQAYLTQIMNLFEAIEELSDQVTEDQSTAIATGVRSFASNVGDLAEKFHHYLETALGVGEDCDMPMSAFSDNSSAEATLSEIPDMPVEPVVAASEPQGLSVAARLAILDMDVNFPL